MDTIIKPTQPVMPAYEDYINEIKDIWETKALTNNGPKLQRLRQGILEYMDCPNAELFVNGHAALLLAIKAMELEGEAITSPFTFISTTNAIVQCGLEPVFCDIDDTYNIDATKIEQHITEKTSAIIVPHIFGIPCDVEAIGRIARKYQLKVIYDGAQAFGTKIGGRHIGNFGDATMFSLHAVKVYNSIEGGLLTYRDETLREKLELYRNFGISYNEFCNDVVLSGVNAKMDEFRAAMGILGLELVEGEITKRKALAQIYREGLADTEGISVYPYETGIDYNYAYFPVRVEEKAFGMSRDLLFNKLKEAKVMTRKLYDTLCCDYSIYKNRNYIRDVEHARKISRECLDLPLYGTLTPDEVIYVCDCIKAIQKEG